MPEKDTVFSSSMKYAGVFGFKEFYKFCYEWLTEETGMEVTEKKYEEKIKGDEKEILIEWGGQKKITDYFRFDMDIKLEVKGLKNVEVVQDGVKVRTNQGSVKITVKGILVRDYESKFEGTSAKKFMRGVYEKFVIPSRVEQMQEKIWKDSDEFLAQAKAYLDIEGRK